ncbi:class I mannose-6-phosphate isomerase [Niameybacter massiliensis]|uniref:Phosphohexomutase n=1 Tax=Holtiella tumoricola TaxID=3018743 RepID=A0AA42DKN7_9FIRM|nr:type I phosphomannose isomerase catalytic subunit [Holtiella tumoricola]MDA3730725.1 class I mannose-6-phosphate isomerase [Holtiella tumoricola]
MKPLVFNPVYVERIWGGRDLENYRNDMPEGVIGESWDVSAHTAGMSVVKQGEYAGKTLLELVEALGAELVGTKCAGKEFPLLVKLINSCDSLSVQVHPGDEYARRVENQFGKTECWYVMDAKEGAELVIGTTTTDKDAFKAAALEGTLDRFLNSIPVKKGDFFYIPSGLIHAIGPGVIIAEIQQSSDITYRVYDYNRGREMHLDKAMEVTDFTLLPEGAINETLLCEGEFFTVEKHVVEDSLKDTSNEEKFFIYTCVEGEGTLVADDFEAEIKLGDSFLIPATTGTYEIKGSLTVLKSFVA